MSSPLLFSMLILPPLLLRLRLMAAYVVPECVCWVCRWFPDYCPCGLHFSPGSYGAGTLVWPASRSDSQTHLPQIHCSDANRCHSHCRQAKAFCSLHFVLWVPGRSSTRANCKAVMAIIRKYYLSLHSSRPEGHDAGCRNGDGARIAPGTDSELAAQHLVSGSARVHNGGEVVSLCVGHCHRERLDAPGAILQASLRLTGLTSSWTEPCCKLSYQKTS